jgi:hypothetical protein
LYLIPFSVMSQNSLLLARNILAVEAGGGGGEGAFDQRGISHSTTSLTPLSPMSRNFWWSGANKSKLPNSCQTLIGTITLCVFLSASVPLFGIR